MNGKRVKEEFLPYLFERFQQADSSTTREFEGLGVGLAIVKQLTELHGGRVRAASEGDGKGTTLTIDLPPNRDAKIYRYRCAGCTSARNATASEIFRAGVDFR